LDKRIFVLEVWGDFACFTRPEMKVERFTYPIITPSAARGIFDAIYCKPKQDGSQAEFRWQITRVETFTQPSYIALRRNEVKDKIFFKNSWLNGELPEPFIADGSILNMFGTDMKGRTQRQTIALKDVRYRIFGEIVPWNNFSNHIKAIEAQFERRAKNGKCIYQPYFGCREFPAFFELVNPDLEKEKPILQDININIGLMLYDVFDLSRPGKNTDKPSISIFDAKIQKGVMEIPPYESPQVYKMEGQLNHA